MTKAVKANFLKSSWILISIFLFCCLIACGGSADSGTTADSGVQITSFAGSPTSLAAGQSSILTVLVTDSSGKAVSGQTVSFDFVANASGGTVTPLNGGTTDAGGKAIAVYRAGATPSTSIREDTIQATCGSATEALIITITASATGAGYQTTLSASVSTLTAGQSSIITATVTSSGVAAANVPVAFSFIGTPASGGTLTPLGTNTDASGKIIAVYKAGTTSPTADVQDTIEANVNSGASFGVVIITRTGTASGSTVVAGYKMTVSADVTSLAAGQSSIITATVTDSSGNAQQGLTVGFSFVGISPSGGSVTALNSGHTDASGTAVAVYTAGATSPTAVVQDTVQALVDSGGYSSSGAVVITRTAASASTPGYQMNLTASTTSVVAGGSSIITATVTNGSGNPVVGMAVNFTFVTTPPSGATRVILGTGTTDASGKAVAIYTAGALRPTEDVQDTFQAEVDDLTYSAYGAVIITRTGSASTTTIPAGYILTLTAPLSSVAAGGHSVLTAKVTDGANNPVSGLTVTFNIPSNSSGATWAPHTATTDAAGRAVTTYTAGSTDSTHTVYDAVTASVLGAADAVVITRTSSSYVPTGKVITVTPTPTSLSAGQSSLLVAEVVDYNGNPLSSETVSFRFVTINSAPTMRNFSGDSTTNTTTPVTATTDVDGQAMVLYTAGTSSASGSSVQDVVTAYVGSGENSAAIITRLANTGKGNSLSFFIGTSLSATATTYTLPTTTSDCIVIAKVVSTEGSPVSGATVNFSILVPSSGGGTLGATATTGLDGVAYVTYTGPGGATAGDAVIQASTTGGVGVGMVFWTAPTP